MKMIRVKKIEFLMGELNISRVTAAVYLNTMTENKLLIKHKIGKTNYYINWQLMDVLTQIK
jgi:hypothetical protein